MYNKEYYEKNKDKIREKQKAYYEANKIHIIERNTKWAKANQARKNKNQRNWRINNPDKHWNNHIKSFYGITLDQYNQMLKDQNNCCYICKKQFNKKPCIDHNHKTGKVRKLLCYGCNNSIGLLKEDINLFLQCIQYLKEHN